MSAVAELFSLKGRLELQIKDLQSELDVISQTIKILERENGTSAQMPLPEIVKPTTLRREPEAPTLGLTDQCLSFLEDTWVAPSTIRDRLLQNNYHMTDKSKLLSSVYATLKRLCDQGRAESQKSSGNTVFRRVQSQRHAVSA